MGKPGFDCKSRYPEENSIIDYQFNPEKGEKDRAFLSKYTTGKKKLSNRVFTRVHRYFPCVPLFYKVNI